MRIGDGKLNLEEDESWLNDYARAFTMSCFRVQPKPDIVNFPTWKYSMWCTHPAQTGVSHILSTSPSLFPKRELYEVLHCWLLLQASCSYSPNSNKKYLIVSSFCTIYHVYIYIVASTSVHECSEPGQNVGVNRSCSINCLWSLNNWKCPFKLLAFINPKSNAAACS